MKKVILLAVLLAANVEYVIANQQANNTEEKVNINVRNLMKDAIDRDDEEALLDAVNRDDDQFNDPRYNYVTIPDFLGGTYNVNMPLLCYCAMKNAQKCLRLLLSTNHDLTVTFQSLNTGLPVFPTYVTPPYLDWSVASFAYYGGSLEIISLLEEQGIIRPDDTIVEAAVLSRNSDAINYAVYIGVPNNRQVALNRGLYTAVKIDDKDAVELLLGLKDDTKNENTIWGDAQFVSNGATLLHVAARNGSANVIDPLIKGGANIEAIMSGDTPLCTAVKSNQYDVAKILIGRGARIDFTDHNGRTLLHLAAMNGNKDLCELLISKQVIDINAEDSYEAFSTPLYYAVARGHNDVAKILLDNGANISAKSRGYTVLHIAAMHLNKEMVEALMAKGADINVKDDSGKTPLHWVGRSDYTKDKRKEMYDWLISKGANPNIEDKSWRTAESYLWDAWIHKD